MDRNKTHDFRILDLPKDNSTLEYVYFYSLNNTLSDNIKYCTKYYKQLNTKITSVDSMQEIIDEYKLLISEKKLNKRICEKTNVKHNHKEDKLFYCNEKDIDNNEDILIIAIDDDYNDLEFLDMLNVLQFNSNERIILINNKTVITLLYLGKNKVILSSLLFSKKGIGLLPLNECKLTTFGLKWNLSEQICKFGGDIVSTSNEIDNDYNNNISSIKLIDNLDSFEVYVDYGTCVVSCEIKN